MVSVHDTSQIMKTRHPNIEARLSRYWDSKEGATIYFILVNTNTDIFRVEKRFKVKEFEDGFFTDGDVIFKFGRLFEEWVEKVNKRKFLKGF